MYFVYFDALCSSIFLHYSLQFLWAQVFSKLCLLSQSFILCPFVPQVEHVLSFFNPVWLVFFLSFFIVSVFLELAFGLPLNWFPVLVYLPNIYFSAFHPLYLLISVIALCAFNYCFIAHHCCVLCSSILIMNNFYAFNLSIFCLYMPQFLYTHCIISVIPDKYISLCITTFYSIFLWATCIAFWWLCFLLNISFICSIFVLITYFLVSSFRLIDLRLLFIVLPCLFLWIQSFFVVIYFCT